jgi:DNA-binding LacI/PurR family transcriptional regulator
MDVRVVVSATSLSSGFGGQLLSHLKKIPGSGRSIVECSAPLNGPDIARTRMLALLESEPRPVGAVVICYRPDTETIEAYRAKGVPIVLVDEEAQGTSTVAYDSFAGGYMAGQYLARSGRKQITVVSGWMQANGGYNALRRVNGFAKAMAEAKLPFRMEDVIQVRDYTHRDGVNAVAQILLENRKIDAVFSAAGDATATGVLAAAREQRIRVPEQLAVVGYDDSPMAAISDPPLTTVRQSLDSLAEEAMRLATTSPADDLLARPQKLLLAPTLVQRQSA